MVLAGTSYATRDLNQHIPVYCGTNAEPRSAHGCLKFFAACAGKIA